MFNALGSIINPMSWFSGAAQPEPSTPSETEAGPDPEAMGSDPYEPTIHDVLIVKAMLIKAMRLPPEIIDQVVEKAEYWPHTTVQLSYGSALTVAGHSLHTQNAPEDVLLIRTPPLGFPRFPSDSDGADISQAQVLPKPPGDPFPPTAFQPLIGSKDPLLAHPCRKIVFTIVSRDQGWGGAGEDHLTYRGSWTWFEAGLERWCQQQQPPSDLNLNLDINNICTVYPEVVSNNDDVHDFVFPLAPVETLKIQCNQTASMHTKEHRVEWRYTDGVDGVEDTEGAEALAAQGRGTGTGDGKFVREMRVGDVVTVWAKARFPGWTNHVESVRVDVYWAL
ncbi:hypothetical protein QBC47DRAFT_375442 [Echria macrotheca]|uniref:Uncharacterized protein n=1 Tax=Echria macrotheca TaxID=438768 RepID=A0AAJ0BI62_9PEZI|nr:hypothetical protein QBC47DRAFT_375442 [Echria macrotheca]